MPSYLDCCQLRELAEGQTVEFHATGAAIEWLKRNREKVLVGTVVVITGMAFIVVVGASGGGALLLMPVVVIASAEGASESRLAVHP